MTVEYTPRQGQYLAFIHIPHQAQRAAAGRGRHDAVFSGFPPSVHQMVLNLEERGLITRIPGQPHSIRLAIPHEKLPALERSVITLFPKYPCVPFEPSLMATRRSEPTRRPPPTS